MSPVAGMQGQIEIKNLYIRLGQGDQAFEAVQNVSVSIRPGEFICLLGPSGCGKSTLLGALAGHLQPSGGTILVDGSRSGDRILNGVWCSSSTRFSPGKKSSTTLLSA
jgi:ABC-type Fe3+/spermidine/putrescine transport system ATPase subunit